MSSRTPVNLKLFVNMGSKVSLFNQMASEHHDRQLDNPFSEWEGASTRRKLSKEDANYGKPIAGSKTEERGRKAAAEVSKELRELCDVIFDCGKKLPDGTARITFGRLFTVYNVISDKCVGLLMRGRKHGYLTFEGEMLFQRRDDDVLIRLLKPINVIRHQFGAPPLSNGGVVPIEAPPSPIPNELLLPNDDTLLSSTPVTPDAAESSSNTFELTNGDGNGTTKKSDQELYVGLSDGRRNGVFQKLPSVERNTKEVTINGSADRLEGVVANCTNGCPSTEQNYSIEKEIVEASDNRAVAVINDLNCNLPSLQQDLEVKEEPSDIKVETIEGNTKLPSIEQNPSRDETKFDTILETLPDSEAITDLISLPPTEQKPNHENKTETEERPENQAEAVKGETKILPSYAIEPKDGAIERVIDDRPGNVPFEKESCSNEKPTTTEVQIRVEIVDPHATNDKETNQPVPSLESPSDSSIGSSTESKEKNKSEVINDKSVQQIPRLCISDEEGLELRLIDDAHFTNPSFNEAEKNLNNVEVSVTSDCSPESKIACGEANNTTGENIPKAECV